MRSIAFLPVLLCCHLFVNAQNLLANGSFEDENICTEYSKNCAPEAWICTSLISDYYVEEPSYAFEGTHFIGLITGNRVRNGVRSFVRSRLLSGLRKGKQYRIECYLRSWHNAFDSVGIYFSNTDFLFETRPYTMLTPALVIRDSTVRNPLNTTYWIKKSLLYTATGDEVFFTIGSFKKNEYHYTMPPDRQLSYYIYIDNISLEPVDPNEKPGPGADSIKAILYGENERHALLDKKRYVNSKRPPVTAVPGATTIRHIDTLTIPDILFNTASATLDEKSFLVLDSFKQVIAGKQVDSLVFEGHTDSIGTLLYNQKLSAGRAKSVADYVLHNTALPAELAAVRYYAYFKPLASNATPAGRRRNRRVEILLYTHE